MKAAVFAGTPGLLEVRELPTPVPDRDEVLVKIAACGLCHTDLHYIDHGVPTFKKPPIILGHEATGVIAALGSGVTAVRQGDRVLIPAVLACGACGLCTAGRSNICQSMKMFGNHVDGAFAEFVTVPARCVFPIPAEVSLEEACVIADAVSTAYHAVINRGRVTEGMKVAVFGCGGVGVNVVQVAAWRGARVTAIDIDAAKLELAGQFGASELVDTRKGNGVPRGFDVSFECIGNPTTIGRAHDCVRRGGRLCIVGYSDRPAVIEVARVMFHEQDIVGSLGCPLELFPEVIERVRQKELRISGLVNAWFPLEKINEGLAALRNGKALRAAVLPGYRT